MVAQFQDGQISRLNILESYSNGNNYTILNGRKRLEPEKADYRIRQTWADKLAASLLVTR